MRIFVGSLNDGNLKKMMGISPTWEDYLEIKLDVAN